MYTTPNLSAEGGGAVEPPTKFSKRVGLTGLQLLGGLVGKRGVNFFMGGGGIFK